MAPQSLTPDQISDTLYAQIPHALSLDLLGEYGIQGSEEKARYLTEEVLSLNLYWIQMAMEAHLTQLARHIIYEIFIHRVKENWSEDFYLDQEIQQKFFAGLKERHEAYQSLTQAGGDPIALFTETAAELESEGVITEGEKSQLLALLIDCIPVDSCGELLEDVDIIEG